MISPKLRSGQAGRPSSKSNRYAWAAAMALGLIPDAAFALAPKLVGNPIVANPAIDGVPNTMMYDVTVKVDHTSTAPDHQAVVGFTSNFTTCAATTDWKWSRAQAFDTSNTRTFTLYNFQPGTKYYYKVIVGNPSAPGTIRTKCGVLQTAMAPTPILPLNLAHLNLTYEKAGAANPYDSKYVLLETDDCGGTTLDPLSAHDYLVVVDPENETIVWYLDIAAATGGTASSGWRYQKGTSSSSGRIIFTGSRRYLYEFDFEGNELNFHDFGSADECSGIAGSTGPCVHHDVFKSDTTGKTYAISGVESTVDAMGTAWEDACGTNARFINDGYVELDSAFNVVSEKYLMTDYGYDPTVDGGPNAARLAAMPVACTAPTWDQFFAPKYGLIDWTHVNAIAATDAGPAGEVIDLSLKEWNQIVRFNASTGDLMWTLSAEPSDSDFGVLGMAPGLVGPATFEGQHDVHGIDGNTLMLLDNRGDIGSTRVLEIALTPPPRTATIERSWALMDGAGDPIDCPLEGSAEFVPGSVDEHVLAMCNDEYSIVEMSDPTGNTGAPPPLVISLPNGSTDDFCSVGGPDRRSSIGGWHRAFPLDNVGDF